MARLSEACLHCIHVCLAIYLFVCGEGEPLEDFIITCYMDSNLDILSELAIVGTLFSNYTTITYIHDQNHLSSLPPNMCKYYFVLTIEPAWLEAIDV